MEEARKEIVRGRKELNIPHDEENSSLNRLRNKPIEGYVPPSIVKPSVKKNAYSGYSTTSNTPYTTSKVVGGYGNFNEKSGYTIQKCFKCESPLDECKCAINSSKK